MSWPQSGTVVQSSFDDAAVVDKQRHTHQRR